MRTRAGLRASAATVVLWAWAGAVTPAEAQGPVEAAETARVAGRVVSAEGGDGVASARVELVGAGRSAYTGREGRFEIGGVAPGEYEVKATASSFGVARVGVRVEAGRDVEVEIRLAPDAFRLPQIEVVADAEATLRRTPGSVAIVAAETLERTEPMSAVEMLRGVAGVVVREDSGPYGLRANIGIRGLNPDRSRKVLVLEDGVPVSLAPYGEPELYYSPPIERMTRVEVVKGSGSILFGPQTIGGVVNYRTADPPLERSGRLEVAGGQRGFLRARGEYGARVGGVGVLAGVLRKQGDGERSMPFTVTDVGAKVTAELGGGSRLGGKLNYFHENSASTYLGLTQPMYEADRWQNPVPGDRLEVRRLGGSLTHLALLGDRAALKTTVYGHTVSRDWRRQDFDREDRGRAYLGVAGDATVAGGAIYLRDSSGNRNRAFDVIGLEPRLQWTHGWLGPAGELEAGARIHVERAVEQRINGSTATASDGERVQDETRRGRAVSAFAQNRFPLGGAFEATAGLRVERFEFDRHIHRTTVDGAPADVDRRSGDVVVEWIPGAGLSYSPDHRWTVFAGAHRGFAPPRIKDAITDAGESLELDAERSWNLELGARAEPAPWSYAEATLFLLDFTNQVIPASESAGGAGTGLINAGATSHRGVETALGLEIGALAGWDLGLRADAKYTFTRARFESGVHAGNRLPYAPEHVVAVGLGASHPAGWAVQLDGVLLAAQYTDDRQTAEPSADGLVGRIPGYRVWDLSARQRFDDVGVTAFVAVKNLLDTAYIVSRAPQGIMPGHPRQVNLGLRWHF